MARSGFGGVARSTWFLPSSASTPAQASSTAPTIRAATHGSSAVPISRMSDAISAPTP
jgi:hypothetical protein